MRAMQSSFERIEKKYILSYGQYEAMRRGMCGHVRPDEYSHYSIGNIYCDTADYSLIRISLEKPVYILKSCGCAAMESRKTESPFLLSSKKKYEGIVYKRRVTAETAEAVNCVRRERLWCSDQIIREINWFLKSYLPQPAAYTGHDREAWAGTDDEELRITFDTNLRGRNWELDLRAGDFGELFLPPELVLMELKLAGGAPMWLANLMSENEVFSSSYSKYGSYYKHLIGQAPAYGIYKTEGKRYA